MEFFKEGLPEPTPEYLKPTEFLDFDTPSVQEFAESRTDSAKTDIEKAVVLYYAVRDAVRQLGFTATIIRRGEVGQPLEEQKRRGFWEFKVTGSGKVVIVASPESGKAQNRSAPA